ncbi:MAG: VOC family protein [Alphaproteobacteria bacterium]
MDLAAADIDRAKEFYARLFGWGWHDRSANGGSFTCLRSGSRDIGSIYQLRRAQLEQGVPSHWTPYVRVDSVDEAVRRAGAIGGSMLVRPFDVSGIARIALIVDAVGAHIGLWESIGASLEEDSNG